MNTTIILCPTTSTKKGHEDINRSESSFIFGIGISTSCHEPSTPLQKVKPPPSSFSHFKTAFLFPFNSVLPLLKVLPSCGVLKLDFLIGPSSL